MVQRFTPPGASWFWFFIGYWILKARLDFYPASIFLPGRPNPTAARVSGPSLNDQSFNYICENQMNG